jgi:hypothetical protein
MVNNSVLIDYIRFVKTRMRIFTDMTKEVKKGNTFEVARG